MSSGSNGKGSKRRAEDSRKLRERWDEIDWTKKPAPEKTLDKKTGI